jgi:hypothetical protein
MISWSIVIWKVILRSLDFTFNNAKKYKINFNLENVLLWVFHGPILGFIVSKEGKIPNPMKVQAIVNMLVPTNPQQI